MWSLGDGTATVVLSVTAVSMLVLGLQINRNSRVAIWCQNVLVWGAVNVTAVAAIYASFRWAPIEFAVSARGWFKFADGLAAFAVAGSMIALHRSLKR
jgi:hypothetical protein